MELVFAIGKYLKEGMTIWSLELVIGNGRYLETRIWNAFFKHYNKQQTLKYYIKIYNILHFHLYHR